MNERIIEARFRKQAGDFQLNVDLSLPSDGITGLFGESGSGKTSLLRCIAGLDRSEGHLTVNAETWQDEVHFIPVHQRPLAYLFQEASLFPHLSVRRNLEYGLRRVDSDRKRISLGQVIDWLGLGQLLGRDPSRLSGGERQRVAIARALLTSPALVLMDEPLSALDHRSKQEILPYLEKLHTELEIPVIYVTHSPDEIARLADHLVVLERGQVIAQGPLRETLARTDLPVRLGDDTGVVIEATITGKNSDWHLAEASFAGGELWVPDMGKACGEALRIRILARDVSIALEAHTDSSIINILPARITGIAEDNHPAARLVGVNIGKDESITPMVARVTGRSVDTLALSKGMSIWIQVKSVAVIE